MHNTQSLLFGDHSIIFMNNETSASKSFQIVLALEGNGEEGEKRVQMLCAMKAGSSHLRICKYR